MLAAEELAGVSSQRHDEQLTANAVVHPIAGESYMPQNTSNYFAAVVKASSRRIYTWLSCHNIPTNPGITCRNAEHGIAETEQPDQLAIGCIFHKESQSSAIARGRGNTSM